jgi:hypothetical protein
LEDLEVRLGGDESKHEHENVGADVQAIDRLERLMEAISKQGSKAKLDILEFKGELNL